MTTNVQDLEMALKLIHEQLLHVSNELVKIKEDLKQNDILTKETNSALLKLEEQVNRITENQYNNKINISNLQNNFISISSSIQKLESLNEEVLVTRTKLDKDIDHLKEKLQIIENHFPDRCALPPLPAISQPPSNNSEQKTIFDWFKNLPIIVQIGAAFGTVSWLIYKFYALVAPHLNLPM